MTTILTKLYETEAQASEVVSRIKAADFIERDITMFTMPAPSVPADGSAAPAPASLAPEMMAAGVYKTAATKYAAKMIPGNCLLVVAAAFGGVGPAAAIMKASPSIDAGVLYEEYLLDQGRNPTSIISVTPNRNSIISVTPKPKPSKPVKPWLGIKTISQPKKPAKRPSNRPLTPGLLASSGPITGGNVIRR
ncbi:MAG: hypothetical protein AAF337_09025 [Pseudomonadota bacterium]